MRAGVNPALRMTQTGAIGAIREAGSRFGECVLVAATVLAESNLYE
jgi:hypothetical protein